MDVPDMAKHPIKELKFLSRDVSKAQDMEAFVDGVGREGCQQKDRTVKEMHSPI